MRSVQWRLRALLILAVTLSVVMGPGAPVGLRAQMDPRAMSGIPRPVDDVPDGTVVVRLVRQELGNYVTDHPVDLDVSGRVQIVRTDHEGRAQFSGLKAGTVVRASATVDGERLESQRFEVPQSGGVRLLLVASAKGTGTPAAPPTRLEPGTVAFAGDSRFIVQFSDDTPEVFYLLDVVNTDTRPVTREPLVFDLPPGATDATILEGSSPQAEARGSRVIISGPFQPGTTTVQIAYSLPASGDRLTISQKLPAALNQLLLAVQKVGNVRLASSQVGGQRDVADEGRTFVMATGPAVRAGDSVTFELTGLPRQATWPRNVALALALVVLAAGAWSAIRTSDRTGLAAERGRLENRRERIFRELLQVDTEQRAGAIDAGRSAARRAELIAELERIYGALDTGPPHGSDKGIAA
jgi:hypothetical protein